MTYERLKQVQDIIGSVDALCAEGERFVRRRAEWSMCPVGSLCTHINLHFGANITSLYQGLNKKKFPEQARMKISLRSGVLEPVESEM